MVAIDKKKFNEDLFLNIKNVVMDYNLIEEGDSIAIALSGGKDSVLTLHVLSYLKNSPDFVNFDLIAISVDEGIEHYRSHGIDAARDNAKKLGIELVEKSFKDEIDHDLDDIYMYFKSACIPCGVFRRNILNKTAYILGADKIATGHNLDDEIQSYLMTLSRADISKFSKFGPISDRIHPKLIPRIKPLWMTLEKNVGTWAILNNINIHLDECPYSNISLRAKTKAFLNNVESKHPGIKKNIMESFKKIFDIESTNAVPRECMRCGEPSSSNLCMSCKIKDFLLTEFNKKDNV
jgi:uncharacterized protein (TIGR00269 family)